jgi:predicted RNase H-like HicB family nuclease
MSQKTSAAPLTVQIAATLPAIVSAEPEAGGFSAEVPALPGCYAQGETMDEVEANLREAIEGWLAAAHDEAMEKTRDEGDAA